MRGKINLNVMDRIFNMEQMRMVVVTCVSGALGFLTPTAGFLTALIIMFGFNVWAGMRADGISIVNCRRFKFSKFRASLLELFLYLIIMESVYTVMVACGDKPAAIVAIKSLTYVFLYVYLQNSFRNLVVAYPNKMALRMIYHIIRLEFTRALPSYLQEIIKRVEIEKEKETSNGESANS